MVLDVSDVGVPAASVVKAAALSVGDEDTPLVMVVCLVTVTVESLGMVCVIPESVFEAMVVVSDEDTEDESDREGESGPDAEAEEEESSSLALDTAGERLLMTLLLLLMVVGRTVTKVVSVTYRQMVLMGALGSGQPAARLQGSTAQQPAKSLAPQRYHWVSSSQTGKALASTSLIATFAETSSTIGFRLCLNSLESGVTREAKVNAK